MRLLAQDASAFAQRPLMIRFHGPRSRELRSYDMSSSTEDKMSGGFHEAKGKIKEEAGKITGNQDLEARGAAEKVGGKVEEKIGDIKKVFEN